MISPGGIGLAVLFAEPRPRLNTMTGTALLGCQRCNRDTSSPGSCLLQRRGSVWREGNTDSGQEALAPMATVFVDGDLWAQEALLLPGSNNGSEQKESRRRRNSVVSN